MITGTTKLLGVIGYPIEHSLSPVMHNTAIAQLQRDYIYLPFPVAPADLNVALDGFAALGVQGFNVTIPHKQTILPFLAEITPTAQAIGAVNTVWHTPQGWMGTNTDVIGFLAPLQAEGRDWSEVNAVILGNGGAARAVVAGCSEVGLRRIQVVGRDRAKLAAFYDSWSQHPLKAALSVHSWGDLPTLLPQAHLLVNTTPIGMHPQAQESPLGLEEMAALPTGAIAYDLIYTPRPTQFLRQAQQQGLTAIDGLEMLVQQGAAALELWLQQPVPVEAMRRSLETWLTQQGR